MRTLLFIATFTIVCQGANAQSFYDDFSSVAAPDLAAASSHWTAVWTSDGWNTVTNSGGAAPNTDTTGTSASFGLPADPFDNAIVTGQTTWRDYGVEADYFVNDNDALGLVFRHLSADDTYILVLSRDQMPAAGGITDTLGGQETRLYRIAGGTVTQLLSPAPQQSHQSNPTLRQRIRVEVEGQEIRVWIGTGSSPVDTSFAPLATITDSAPNAPASGMTGLYAFAMGESAAGTYFDSFRVEPLDSDQDGRNNDDEIALGTDPYDGDSDDDGVSDGNEFQWGEDPDSDGLPNALDPDSDDDGLPDGLEQGLQAPHPDTDLTAGNFIADQDPSTTTDHLDEDSDDGGVEDGAEDLNANGRYESYLGETDPNEGSDDGEYPDGGVDTDADTDTDSDTDSDSDTDADTDTDTDTETPAFETFLAGGHACTATPAAKHSLLSELLTLFLF